MGECSSSMGLDRTGLISIAEENTDDIGAGDPPGVWRCGTALQTLLGLVRRSAGNAVSRAEDEPER
jgi:hypothetical protein